MVSGNGATHVIYCLYRKALICAYAKAGSFHVEILLNLITMIFAKTKVGRIYAKYCFRHTVLISADTETGYATRRYIAFTERRLSLPMWKSSDAPEGCCLYRTAFICAEAEAGRPDGKILRQIYKNATLFADKHAIIITYASGRSCSRPAC